MKKIHQTYCAMHPKAIVIVDKYKENLNVFMENQGAAKPVNILAVLINCKYKFINGIFREFLFLQPV